MKSMHENNVIRLCAKYAVDVNLFRLESSILTRAKRATNRNNVGGEHSLEEYTGVERSGRNFPGGVCLEPLKTPIHSKQHLISSYSSLFLFHIVPYEFFYCFILSILLLERVFMMANIVLLRPKSNL